MIKKYDIAAIVGTYQKNGETKNKYKNVGVIMEKDGKPFILLERTFNHSALPNPDNRETVLLSLFTPKEDGKQSAKPDTWELNDEISF